jgi:hypothetical protein
MMLLSATSNGVGVNVRLVGYGLSVSRYQGIYNLSVVPTGRPKAFGRPRSLQCNKTVLLLVLLVKLQSYDVWKAGKIIAQT